MSRMIHIRFFGLIMLMLTMFSMSAFATNKDYYSKITAKAVGEGKVYVKYNSTTSSPEYAEKEYTAESGKDSQKEAPTHTYYLYAQAKSGAEFIGWYDNADCTGNAKSNSSPYTATITAAENTATATYYALFKPFFKFSATANKINGSYGTTTATVAAAKVLGSSTTSTSASTTATFTATPENNCTFEGWYTDDAHTTPASVDNSYKNATFTTTITNNSKGTTKNLTLYAWFKSNQTLNWSNEYNPNVVNGLTSSGAATATATSGLTVSYSTSAPAVATVNTSGDITGVSVSTTPVIITASQAGNDVFNAATSINRSFTVINRYQATFEVVGFTGINPTLEIDETPTITAKDIDSDFTFNSSDPSVVGIAKSGNVITLTALKVGTSTVTLTQPENGTHAAAGATYNITVTKITNNLAVELASQSAEVDGTINVSFSDRNNTATAIVGTITDTALSSSVNNGTDVITYANGIITACNAGTAKITFTQAATDKYEGYTSSTYTITVTKKSNPITITLAGGSSTNIKMKYGVTASLSYSSVNPAPTLEVNRVSGTYTTYSNGTITAGNTQGTDIYEITQDETYKYEAGYAQFTVRVNNTNEEDGYVLSQQKDEEEVMNSMSSPTDKTYSWDGPCAKLSFRYRAESKAATGYIKVYAYTDKNCLQGETLIYTSDLPVGRWNTTDWQYVTDTILDKNTYRSLKFKATGALGNGTLTKYIGQVRVTRDTYVTASSINNTAFGIVYTDASPKPTATFTVNYSTTNGGNVVVSSNNAHFVASSTDFVENKTEFATTNNSDGTKTFTVTYNPDPNQLGAESAVITVGDLFYSQQITLTATAAKHANTLAVIGTQNLKVDDVVSNVYSLKNSLATLNCALSREGVIEYDPSTNKITAVGAGTATLTLSQAANDYYLGTSKTVTVNVSKYDQTISWDNVLSDEERILEVDDVLTTNTATASSKLAVTYSSSNSTVLEVNASTGELMAKDGGANIVITARQAGNYKYNEVSITRLFTVIKRVDPKVYTTLSESETNNFPIGNPDITIRCNATITESAFTITGNSEGYVSTFFANNTLTISALKEGGTVTVMLSRPQDLGFYELNKSYTIQVVKPVAVLEPTEAPDFSYSEYSCITLNRTLKSGYSTIALPFDTDVETLTGRTANADDWVAQLSMVAYNGNDGYSLYFQKTNTIEANQPYILHLGSAVNSPVFTNVTVVAAQSLTNVAGKGVRLDQWAMHSNYNPNFDMNGKYGVVNDEENDECKIKLGSGTNAKLKAFRAYITTPANPQTQVKAAYLDEDNADGLLEVLYGEVSGTESVYDLQGRKLPKAQRGLNIIRGADGSVKKVMNN